MTLYFQFDVQTGDHLKTFEGRKPVHFKKEINGAWDNLKSANDIYKHPPDKLFSEFGVKAGTIVKPSLDYGKKHGASVDDVNALTRTYPVVDMPNLVEKESQQRENWKDQIDLAAGEARAFFAPYKLIDEEYSRTYNLTEKWLLDTNEPTPSVVTSWATASGMTDALAAANIIETGDQYNAFLDTVRDLRLNGKASVASIDGSLIKETGQSVIESINALYVPPEELGV